MKLHRQGPDAAGAARLALAAALLALGGCGSIQSFLDPSNIDYRSSARGPGLDVPPDLVGPKVDERYVVPERGTGQTFSGYSRERQAGSRDATNEPTVLATRQGARIERDGALRWLVLEQPPEKLWPLLKEFWVAEGFVLALDASELGIMETDWVKRQQKAETSGGLRGVLSSALGTAYSTYEQDRYRTRIERAPNGGTEVFISHKAMEEVVDKKTQDSTVWQPAPSRPELEIEFMRRLMLRLGSPPAQVAGIVAEAAAKAPERATVQPDQGVLNGLSLREGFDRAWREVGLVIDRIGFTVEDRDRSKGTYFVRYVDLDRRDPRQGTLSRIFSGERRDLAGQRYQIIVKGEGAASAVSVRGEAGKAPESEADLRIANRIIALLHERMR